MEQPGVVALLKQGLTSRIEIKPIDDGLGISVVSVLVLDGAVIHRSPPATVMVDVRDGRPFFRLPKHRPPGTGDVLKPAPLSGLLRRTFGRRR